MDYYGSKYKCEHEECPYKDCNYHYKSTGKYSHADLKDAMMTIITGKNMFGIIILPKNEEEASWCMHYLDI